MRVNRKKSEKPKRHVSMEDVARRAGVSLATVSRVVNNVDYPVSDSIRERVHTAVDELNYLPNISAQLLRKSFNNLIGLIVRDIADSYFGEIARGVTEKALELGYLSFVCNTGREAATELRYHELLWQHRVRGIILAGGGIDTGEYNDMLGRQISRFHTYGLRIVSLAPQGVPVTSVSVDYTEVASMITEYLLGRSHNKIAVITGRDDVVTSVHHITGYRSTIKKFGVPYDERRIVYADFTEADGYKGLISLLARKVSFSALFCGSDTIAMGALQALSHKNLYVPKDISIISVGNLPQSRFTSPPLTTVQIPRYEIGAHAVELIAGDQEFSESNPEVFTYHPIIIERSSVKDLRQQ